ncbi:hypothetical protein GRW19_27100, partial [Escherichia coli]|nr:hypothetical protein [Escherichia coli]
MTRPTPTRRDRTPPTPTSPRSAEDRGSVVRLVGLAATLALLAVVAGVPALLALVGTDVIPDQIPSPAEIWAAASTRDDGTLAIAGLTLAAWAAWLLFAVLVLL